MTTQEAQRIGIRKAIAAVFIGLLVAQVIMTLFSTSDGNFWHGFFWFADFGYGLNIAVAVLVLLFLGYLFGRYAGKAILIREKSWVSVGLIGGLCVLLLTAFSSGWVGFFQEGLDNNFPYGSTTEEPFLDYIVKPFFWVSLIGLIPALIVGLFCGYAIHKKKKE